MAEHADLTKSRVYRLAFPTHNRRELDDQIFVRRARSTSALYALACNRKLKLPDDEEDGDIRPYVNREGTIVYRFEEASEIDKQAIRRQLAENRLARETSGMRPRDLLAERRLHPA